MKDVLDLSWNISQAVAIPVMADIDTGGGNAVNAAWITERLVAMGVAGMNIEDQVSPSAAATWPAGSHLGRGDGREDPGLRRGPRPARQGLHHQRPDRRLRRDGLAEAIKRCNIYLEPAPTWPHRRHQEPGRHREGGQVDQGPLSVNLMDAITGMKTELIPIPELAKMGVGRVSIPVASIMVVHKALTNFFKALKASPTGTLPGQTQWVSSFEEYTDFVGLKEYRAMENEYLPCERVAAKYKGVKKIVGKLGRIFAPDRDRSRLWQARGSRY